MVYNRFLYNSALYNAGRDEAAAVARSIIQAHTGPHIQAVVGSTGGISLISDFVIQLGTGRELPRSFKFPDLSAILKVVFPGQPPFTQDDPILNAFIKGIPFKDLPASIFPSDRIPDLKGIIFGLFEANLIASIIGQLGESDLAAVIEANSADLAAIMQGLFAPNLGGIIFGQEASNLGARIHAPLDLPAILQAVNAGDLSGILAAIQFKNLSGTMLGVAAPEISAFIRAFQDDTKDLPALTGVLNTDSNLFASIGTLPGPNDLTAILSAGGAFNDIVVAIRGLTRSFVDLGASIATGGVSDLTAILNFFGARNLKGLIGTIPEGAQDKFLQAFLQPVMTSDLSATMTLNENVAFLSATLLSLRGFDDLGASIKVAETFITALLTISTLASRDLRATIGNPVCAGGSANDNLGASAIAQLKGDIGASIESFAEANLGAFMNTTSIFHAFDTISVSFSPRVIRTNLVFRATDTIPIIFSPFRGQNLGALISSIQNNVDLGATITAAFPLPRVVPAVSVLTAADLRLNEDLDIQEIRFQLEGTLFEYIYVNGTEQSFIRDANEDWKINIRTFRTIAADLFGDRAANKICRLGDLTSFATIDQAVRSCIQAVLGFEEEVDLGAIITSTGQIDDLAVFIDIQNDFGNLPAIANRVFPFDFTASIEGTGGHQSMSAIIQGTGSSASSIGATIQQESQTNLFVTISGSP